MGVEVGKVGKVGKVAKVGKVEKGQIRSGPVQEKSCPVRFGTKIWSGPKDSFRSEKSLQNPVRSGSGTSLLREVHGLFKGSTRGSY